MRKLSLLFTTLMAMVCLVGPVSAQTLTPPGSKVIVTPSSAGASFPSSTYRAPSVPNQPTILPYPNQSYPYYYNPYYGYGAYYPVDPNANFRPPYSSDYYGFPPYRR